MIKYLQLIRFKNLLLVGFMQLMFRYGFLKLNNVELALTDFQFLLLLFATILLAAGGYVIYSILHQANDIDTNKKIVIGAAISENWAYNFYFALTIAAVAIGYYLSNVIQRPGFLVFFITAATLLYFYASQLKYVLLLGNLVVSFLVAFSILIIGFFDLFPATDFGNTQIMRTYFSILFDYSVMAFLIILCNEIIKDIAHFERDYNNGNKTLAVVIGIKNSKYAVAVLVAMPVVLILKYINTYLMTNNLFFAAAYGLLFLIAPLLYVIIRLLGAKSKFDYEHINKVLKIIIVFGILSVLIMSKNIIYNVTPKL